MSAVNVGSHLAKLLTSFSTSKFILEKDLTSVVNVGNPSAPNLFSLNTKEFTLEKDLNCLWNTHSFYCRYSGAKHVRAVNLN